LASEEREELMQENASLKEKLEKVEIFYLIGISDHLIISITRIISIIIIQN
jgi:hypothetical protein